MRSSTTLCGDAGRSLAGPRTLVSLLTREAVEEQPGLDAGTAEAVAV